MPVMILTGKGGLPLTPILPDTNVVKIIEPEFDLTKKEYENYE